jgi:hypothetical protein
MAGLRYAGRRQEGFVTPRFEIERYGAAIDELQGEMAKLAAQDVV